MSLLDTLKLGTKNCKMVKWPGTDTEIAMSILSQQQIQDAVFATERLFKGEKIEMNMGTADEYDSELSTQKLFRSIHDPKDMDKPVATTITEFRKALTREDRTVLIEEYLAFEKECSPSPDNLTNDEFDQLLSDLKKTPHETLGRITSISTLKKLLLIMASRPVTLPAVNG